MKKFRFLGLAVVLAFLAGCGYTTHAFVSKTGYKTIYIGPFVNKVDTTSEFSEGRKFKTYFPLLENKITNAVVDRFIFDGNLKIAKEGDADLILKGELVNYSRQTLRNSTADTPEEYRVTIFVNISLVDAKTGKTKWEYKDFAGDASYFTTGQFVKSEEQAVADATRDLARRIVETTVEAW
ncbi:MAG: LptE family protein [Candidatus Omnitrophica bacterium]|nr:LptE family protein [Candidatus Omnitrophota bacterium]